MLVTFRIAGPIYRFEQYLAGIAEGRQLGPCRIREGDELVELCARINEATAPLRRGQLARPGEPEGETCDARSTA